MDRDPPSDFSDIIRTHRAARGWTQVELAERMGVTNVTISRWEKGRVVPSSILWGRFLALAKPKVGPRDSLVSRQDTRIDFVGDGRAVRAMVQGERLAFGHLVNPTFATEVARIDALPHQRMAVYDQMLPQARLRFLLADDAGAGKTVMTGLYIREMLARRLLKRILIVPPAGLVGNWQSELRELFGMEFTIVTGTQLGQDAGNPFAEPDRGDRVICSVDTLRGERAFRRLADDGVAPYELVVFDEAHKLSARQDADLTIRKTARYQLAEALAGVPNRKADWALAWSARHLLLLTATPHMGREYPYFALWRLLDPQTFSTVDAFRAMGAGRRARWFIRRTKEEMIGFDGKPLYPKRTTDTFSYELGQGAISEQTLYDKTTDYLRFVYNRARLLNRTAARLALLVFQRRLASSTYALLRSLERRLDRLDEIIRDVVARRVSLSQLLRDAPELEDDDDPFEARTADEEEAMAGMEENERAEEKILAAALASTVADLEIEKEHVRELIELAAKVQASGQESKFDRLRDILADPRFKGEKFLIFTEHRDTLTYLRSRLEGMGFSGQIGTIHGGMNYVERAEEVAFFRKPLNEGGARVLVCTDAAGEGINLQFCWVMVNFDMPWNPARLEQRMGRIHRYGQKRPEVFILNLIAGDTREGQVIRILLEKLEAIRKEMRSEKVFDVIGRVFQDVRISDYMERALLGEDGRQLLLDLGGHLTKEQVEAVAERERRLYGDGGDVKASLPELRRRMDAEVYSQLLPGYVRQYMRDAAPLLKLSLSEAGEGEFQLAPKSPRALDPFLPLLSSRDAGGARITFSRRVRGENGAAWVHPGEPIFERFRALVVEASAASARRGAIFVDPAAEASYLLHLASVVVLRRADPTLAALRREEVIEHALVAVSQNEAGVVAVRPVEEFLLCEPASGGLPPDAQRLAVSAGARIEEARAFLVGDVAKAKAQQRRDVINADLTTRLNLLRQGFVFEQTELAEARSRWNQKKREGNRAAEQAIERIRELQRAWESRLEEAEQTILREPGLIGVGPVEFLAHVLVRPAGGEQEAAMRYDAEVERIAMERVIAHERAAGADVKDVHTPELALRAGLHTPRPGFDVLSWRPDGTRRCIEIKGRARRGRIHISTNEWSAACNRRGEFWLYGVFDCATPVPQIVAVQDPFGRLLAKTTGFELDAEEIFAQGEVL